MNTSYIIIECVASPFKAKDGTTVDGYNVFVLERKADGSRVYWNVVRKWVRDVPAGVKFGSPCNCRFDSNGKLIGLDVL